MARTTAWSERLKVTFAEGTSDRIATVLLDNEDRTAFVREAVDREIERRANLKGSAIPGDASADMLDVRPMTDYPRDRDIPILVRRQDDVSIVIAHHDASLDRKGRLLPIFRNRGGDIFEAQGWIDMPGEVFLALMSFRARR
jgi:hypothetical protein